MGHWSIASPTITVDTVHTKDNCVWLNNKIMCELQLQEQETAAKVA